MRKATAWVAMMLFGCLVAAVFAQPAIAEIEEVVGLIQRRVPRIRRRVPVSVKNRYPTPVPFLLSALRAALGCLNQANWNCHAPAVAHNLDVDRIADLVLLQDSGKIVSVVDLLALDADDDVP